MKINLLPLEYNDPLCLRNLVLGFFLSVVFGFISCLLVNYFLTNALQNIQQQNRNLQQQLAAGKYSIQSAEIKNQTTTTEVILQKISYIQLQQTNLWLFLANIPKFIATSNYLTAIKKNNNVIFIKGIAATHRDIQVFIQRMQSQFPKSLLINTQQDKTHIEFVIKSIL